MLCIYKISPNLEKNGKVYNSFTKPKQKIHCKHTNFTKKGMKKS